MPYRTVDLAGQRFGKLVAIGPTAERSSGRVVWECICDCGKPAFAQSSHLVSGHTKSCGCYSREKTTEMNTTHGCTHTRLYRIWTSMKTRCTNPKSKTYDYYGGRGIGICSEWMDDFSTFHNWAINNGYAEELTIDRINGDRNYSPDNCRWATWHEQRINQRRSNRLG